MEEEATSIKALFLEYQQTKEEQKSRIAFRDNLPYVTLGLVAAVLVAGSLSTPLLLLISAATPALGWLYLANDKKISDMGRYIRTSLDPRLGAISQEQVTMFAWEHFHRSDAGRTQRRTIQCAVDLALFTGIPTVALAVCWSGGRNSALSLAVSAIEVAAVITLAIHIVKHAKSSH
ncbi:MULTISPECIES: hypothetical protein [Kitasatospora]|uniref:Integral membrane protein n=1 Tax=Kitasatospora setae (strain ATCC 33774 / DSM 43861 / JCM 3304 / KCC A-0304 / NBRC 14216 / KM-6054) TaxID=452652 RepID=E4NK19_KITSK|nr:MULTISPECIES: hypothetical protein [Kitasatospora]BAJ33317.1 hypothetical protein KSE_75640 [Kitasatospora setae KM-6054]